MNDQLQAPGLTEQLYQELRHCAQRILSNLDGSIAELHYLAGFSQKKIAEMLSLSLTAVERELKFARSFLTDRLQHSHA